jgi:hypothetical protein
MLSTRLVQMIEDHAEELTNGVVHDLKSNKRTPHYHHLSQDELHRRTYGVYRNLSHWLSHKTDEAIEVSYNELAKTRFAEGVPLSEIVFALTLTKYHLRDYIRSAGLMDSAVELYQEQELRRLVGSFFDRAIYHTVRGYEHEAALQHGKSRAA